MPGCRGRTALRAAAGVRPPGWPRWRLEQAELQLERERLDMELQKMQQEMALKFEEMQQKLMMQREEHAQKQTMQAQDHEQNMRLKEQQAEQQAAAQRAAELRGDTEDKAVGQPAKE